MNSSHWNLPTIMAGFLMITASTAHAEVIVRGTPEVIHVEAKNASIEEVLRALHDTYSLTYQSAIPLDTHVSGTYEGSLSKVLARLLEGRNFVLTHNGNTLQVAINSSAGAQPIPGAPSALPFPIPQTKASPNPQFPMRVVLPPSGPPQPSLRD